MGWKENRRRKRRWYKKFDAIAVALVARVSNQQATVTMADILRLFYQFAVAHRLFKYNWIKESAAESLLLVDKDRGLGNIQVTGKVRRDEARGPSPLAVVYEDFAEANRAVQQVGRLDRKPGVVAYRPSVNDKPVYDNGLPPAPDNKEPEPPF